MSSPLFFLLLTLFCVLAEAFFSMFEMASVSFNKVRLHYFVAKKNKKALWLQFLLNKPTALFGTILIAVNGVEQLGSEASRRFYEAVGLNPNFAPISQILIVLIFGELAPIFAARKHSEEVALKTIPVIYFLSKILFPFIWLIDSIYYLINKFFGESAVPLMFLSREEIQKTFEEKKSVSESENMNTAMGNIFSLKSKRAKEMMSSLETAPLISSTATVDEAREILRIKNSSFLFLYQNDMSNISSIIYLRDLLCAKGNETIFDFSNPSWFVFESTPILEVVKQFGNNDQVRAVVINARGRAVGIISLDRIIDEIFEKEKKRLLYQDKLIERTLSGDMLLFDFNEQFRVNLAFKDAKTISDLIHLILGHPPSKGEIIYVGEFELRVEEPSLLGAKTVLVKTIVPETLV